MIDTKTFHSHAEPYLIRCTTTKFLAAIQPGYGYELVVGWVEESVETNLDRW